ncbi:MAG: glycosyltransferase [Ignavibacteriae bacterium]|nr:glycosyltransferase [Ignavibacteriota bacterium]
MKKVLIVAYYFPPSGGPGVQRVLKFVKYLTEFGWQPVVLTVENGDYPARDESLLAEIPKRTTVYRTKIFEPYALYRKFTGKPAHAPVDVETIPSRDRRKSLSESFAEFIRSTFFIPDARIGWYPYAVAKGLEIIENERIDAIYSSSPPYTTAVIAQKLQRSTGKPWLAGFRDPWTGFLSTPNRWLFPRAIDRAMEHSVFKDAGMVEGAWRGILKDIMDKYPDIPCEKLYYLPNGFDAADYPSDEQPVKDKFTVTYTGSMYGLRNPKTFLQAVEELVGESKIAQEKIRLKFIGRFGSEVQEMFRASSIRESIEVVPYLPHGESIRELLRAHTLLLVVDETKDSREIVPGKVFEYIGARRPILALASDGAAAELLRETRSGYVAPNTDILAIKNAFLECYEKFGYRQETFEPNGEAIRKYERREIASQLAVLLDTLYAQHTTPRR